MRTLSLIIVTFTYLLVGAAIFDALEGPNNEKVKEGLVQLRENLKQKYSISEDDYKVIEVLIEERKPHKTGPQWKFAGSLYFAFVTLALIGLIPFISILVMQLKKNDKIFRLRSLDPRHEGWEDVHSGVLSHRHPTGAHHVPEHRSVDSRYIAH